MKFAQHIRSLSADELRTIANAIQKETDRRDAFVACLPEVNVRGLHLTIKTRDLLYRVLMNRLNGPIPTNGALTIKNLFTLLKKEDWLHMEYINSRAFLEMKAMLMQYDAPLEEYYGVFTEPEETATPGRRLRQAVDDSQL